jgi:hypothetical protein
VCSPSWRSCCAGDASAVLCISWASKGVCLLSLVVGSHGNVTRSLVRLRRLEHVADAPATSLPHMPPAQGARVWQTAVCHCAARGWSGQYVAVAPLATCSLPCRTPLVSHARRRRSSSPHVPSIRILSHPLCVKSRGRRNTLKSRCVCLCRAAPRQRRVVEGQDASRDDDAASNTGAIA